MLQHDVHGFDAHKPTNIVTDGLLPTLGAGVDAHPGTRAVVGVLHGRLQEVVVIV